MVDSCEKSSKVHARRHPATEGSAASAVSAPSERQPASSSLGSSSLHHAEPAQKSSKFVPLELESGGDSSAERVESDEELVHPLVGCNNDDSPSIAVNKRDVADDHHGAAPPGSATMPQVIINIVISFVGAGLLGIPNAFSQSGWLLGSFTLLTVSALNVYAMLCLPQVQIALQRQHPNETIQSYGDLGRFILGGRGEKIIFVCLGISQAGFATAYIIFIAANLNSIYNVSRGFVCFACIPGLSLLVQFRDLKSLSPFSLLANTANFCALLAVLFQDYES